MGLVCSCQGGFLAIKSEQHIFCESQCMIDLSFHIDLHPSTQLSTSRITNPKDCYARTAMLGLCGVERPLLLCFFYSHDQPPNKIDYVWRR